jgi:hypothetical protein
MLSVANSALLPSAQERCACFAAADASNDGLTPFARNQEALLPMLGEILKVLAHCFATSSSAGCLDAVGTAIKVYGHHSDRTFLRALMAR